MEPDSKLLGKRKAETRPIEHEGIEGEHVDKKIKKEYCLEKVISGAQVGVDQVGLQVAQKHGFLTGGTVPKRCLTAQGYKPELIAKYNLTELNHEIVNINVQYVKRSIQNVDDSDATLAFRFYASPGTDSTIRYCLYKRWGTKPRAVEVDYKPCLVISDVRPDNLEENVTKIKEFLKTHPIQTLNIAGHREDNKKDPRMCQNVEAVLDRVFLEIRK